MTRPWREEIAEACLEGLIETPHGYRYRPSKGADAVLAKLADLLGSDEVREAVGEAILVNAVWDVDPVSSQTDAALAVLREMVGSA